MIIPFVQVATAFQYDTQVTWANPNNDGIDEGMTGIVLGWKNTKVSKVFMYGVYAYYKKYSMYVFVPS